MGIEKAEQQRAGAIQVGDLIEGKLKELEQAQSLIVGQSKGFSEACRAVEGLFEHVRKARDSEELTQETSIEVMNWLKRAHGVIHSLELKARNQIQQHLGSKKGLEVALAEASRFVQSQERKIQALKEKDKEPKKGLRAVKKHPGPSIKDARKASDSKSKPKAKK